MMKEAAVLKKIAKNVAIKVPLTPDGLKTCKALSDEGTIVDRGGGTLRFDVPHESLLDVDLPVYQPDQCPLCEKGLPVVKPGSRPVVA
jgi:hypothetical protein